MSTEPTATSNFRRTRGGALGIKRAAIGAAFAVLLGMGVLGFPGAAIAQDFADDHLANASPFVVAELFNVGIAPASEIDLAGEHGRGGVSISLKAPSSNVPSVILWDEFTRKITAPSVGTNIQGNVSFATRQ